jgi:hypothetical protein
VPKSTSCVRLAFVTSVKCTPPAGPPVKFQSSHVSIVPNSASPAAAFARAPGTLSSSHLSLRPLKYVASGKPVRARNRSWPPSRAKAATSSAVRVSCHTSAFASGAPVFRSHTTVVSRWFVMPTAASSLGFTPPRASASAITAWVLRQISAASCSTQPGFG